MAGKGLKSGALGLWGNVTIGLASTAPAYSLAATLGYVVLAVGDKAPAMFIVAFIPMLLVAIAYRDLNRAAPDCGTTFTWGTKAFGPIVGWLGGWGVAVSAIIVLANVAEIAAIYTLRFFGLDDLAENPIIKVGLGIVFIAIMTYVSYRGIVISEHIQAVLVSFQFVVLIVMSVIALTPRLQRLGRAIKPCTRAVLVLPVWADSLRDRGRSDLVHLHLLGLGFLSCRDRRDQGRRQDAGASGFALYGHPALHLLAGGYRHSSLRGLRGDRHWIGQ